MGRLYKKQLMIEQVCVEINDLSQLRPKQLVQDVLNTDSEGNEVELILVNEGQAKALLWQKNSVHRIKSVETTMELQDINVNGCCKSARSM